MKTLSLALLPACCSLLAAAPAEPPWQDLFNGKDLAGWTQRGGAAKYRVENGEIIGTSTLHTPNSFLCTDRIYGDFVLEYEFKIDPRLNSGVQFRSECFEVATEVEWKGEKMQIPAGRVHGYQCEIDPDVKRARMWSTGIFDEARRGWLFPGQLGGDGEGFSARGAKLFKAGDWNKVRIEALGDSIRTFLNGAPTAEIRDGLTPRGFIALQVHGIGNDKAVEGSEVAWRNLRIQEIANSLSEAEKKDGWKLLFDGEDTAAWRSARGDTFPEKGWEVRDGELIVLGKGGGDIITRNRYADFEFKADFKITKGANSGIKYFTETSLDMKTGQPLADGKGAILGLEYQILDDENHADAGRGSDGNRTAGSLYDLIPAAAGKRVNPPGEWNTAHIISKGPHVEHWLNGRKVLEYERGSAEYKALVAKSKYRSIPGFGEGKDGHILLQDHGDEVAYRNIKVRH